jgi:hypothetical protein
MYVKLRLSYFCLSVFCPDTSTGRHPFGQQFMVFAPVQLRLWRHVGSIWRLKKKALRSFETSEPVNPTTRRHISEDYTFPLTKSQLIGVQFGARTEPIAAAAAE